MKKKVLLVLTCFGILGIVITLYLVNRSESTDIRDKAADSFDPGTCTYTVLTNGDLNTANLLADDGDIVCIMPGTYTTPINPTNNGSLGAYIFYKGVESTENDVVMGERVNLYGKEYIWMESIKFDNEGGTWIDIDSDSSSIHIEDCYFDTETSGSWSALNLQGSYITLKGNTFGRWDFGDMVDINAPGNHVLVEDNDFSQAFGEHSLVSLNGDNCVVRHNYFRNPCDRAITASYHTTHGGTGDRNLIEYNVFVDCNKDDEDISNDCPGANQSIKFNMLDSIFRNNLIIGSNEGHDYDYQGTLNFGTYEDVIYYERNRIYHNTFYANMTSGISFSRNTDTWYTYDNDSKNNIITESEEYEILLERSGLFPSENWLFDTNIIASSDDATSKPIYIQDDPVGNREYTAEEANAMHEEFVNNIGVLPSYSDTNILDLVKENPENYSLKDFDTIFEAFLLSEGSEGKNDATYLTTVTRDSIGSTEITVEDARYFYDGEGIIVGDEIMIGTEVRGWKGPYEIEDANYDTNVLTLDASVTVDSGDEVYLDETGTDPDIGIYQIGEEEPCEPDCSGKQCGGDGCEGSCGTCISGKVCKEYICVEGKTYSLYNADLNYDSKINIFDLTILLNNWKIDNKEEKNIADINDDKRVNMLDLAILKSQWTKKY